MIATERRVPSCLRRRVTQFLKDLKAGLIQEVPPEYEACESCRELDCTTERAATCEIRLQAEREQKSRLGIKPDAIRVIE